MIISTKGRYALRVMIDLAEHYGEGYVPMKEAAERQDISLKYLERILPVLTKNKMIEGLQGNIVWEIFCVLQKEIWHRWLVLAVTQMHVSVLRHVRHCPCGRSFID